MSQGLFVSGAGVGLEALRRRIREHLGPDVVVESSTYKVDQWCFNAEAIRLHVFQGVDGYILSATRPQTIVS